ncbi:MAG: protein arginine kinase [Clostridia bacterium]|nr:protein arginine kinase [Clostridia bacterium]
MIWYKNDNPEIVVSTRVRLARNLKGIPFPERLKDKEEYIKKIKDAVFLSNSTLSSDFTDVKLENLSDKEKLSMVEKHLISSQMLRGGKCDCLINKDNTMSLMIMEEDHIREQVILGGYKPDEAYEICNRVDDVLSESLNFAFDEKLGYLTACPTNVGTGLRVSVMLHLPALTLTGRIGKLMNSAANVGIAVRGYYGEGTQAEGCFYQISNQITMGVSEKEIISRVKNVTDQIVAYEKEARDELLNQKKFEIEDRVWRAYGTLKYSRIISSKEVISHLSDVLLGINLGIITVDTKIPVMELIVKAQPGNLGDTNMSASERDVKRARFIRESI